MNMTEKSVLRHPVPRLAPGADSISGPRVPDREAYAQLAHGLNDTRLQQNGSRAILVTSSLHGEGASSVARGLAGWILETGQRVALVDANLRTPSQHLAEKIQREGGLSELFSGLRKLSDSIRWGADGRYGLITSGQVCSNPSRLLTQKTLKALLTRLREEFSWVVLDGPPLTCYPEALELARNSDGVVLVIRAEHTRREVAEHARRLIETSGTELLGAVLNRRRFHIPEWIYGRL